MEPTALFYACRMREHVNDVGSILCLAAAHWNGSGCDCASADGVAMGSVDVYVDVDVAILGT